MENPELARFKSRLEELENQIDSLESDDFQEQLLQLEEEIKDMESLHDPAILKGLGTLLNKIKKIKHDNDFYDEEGERDMMFPNE